MIPSPPLVKPREKSISLRAAKALKNPKSLFVLAFLITILFNGMVLAYFHNRFWWPPDEGAYAHTAQRILGGEALNSDVEEIHTGYLNFLHAAAFSVFGLKLVSLRYPLVTIALIQSCLLFLIFARHNLYVAVIAALSATSMGVIQFLNPQPSWYCLLLASLMAYCLTYIPQERKWRITLVGFLVGLVFLFRQLTGVFVAMAVLTYLLTERRDESQGPGTWVARGLLGLMLLGTVIYLGFTTNPFGLLLFGIWPITVLMQALFFTNTTNKKSLEIVKRLGIGCFAAALPILLYHAAHGSLGSYFDDTVIRALTVSRLPYLKQASYATVQTIGIRNFLEFDSFAEVLNGIYWFTIPFTALVTGIGTLRAFRRSRASSLVGALPIIAVFYALVALFQQIPIYLFYTLPLSLAGLFWLSLKSRRQLIWALGFVAIFFSVISVYYHAGQPVSRLLSGIIRGDRISLVPAIALDRSGLWIDSESLKVYTELVQMIRDESEPNETIFALPNNPELYFLAGRRNPFRFWNTAVGVRNEQETMEVIGRLKREPPRIITVISTDKNNTQYSNQIISHVRKNYILIKTVSSFEVYRSR